MILNTKTLLVCAMIITALAFAINPAKIKPYELAENWVTSELIEYSWKKRLHGDIEARPWPWMKSVPEAKLTIPDFEKEFVIMRGTDGNILAYTPGWHEGSDKLGVPGISLVSAYKDRHFEFLRHMKPGQKVNLSLPNGELLEYEVEGLSILHGAEMNLSAEPDESVLLLSTHYPFSNWQKGDEVRFVVVARALTKIKRATS